MQSIKTETFLAKAAEKIFQQFQIQDLKDICVVLPSRRATFFFKKELAELSSVPFLSPEVYAIDDFVCELSGFQIADQISLLFDLYSLYSPLDPEISFEDFISWAPTVLKDFDLIDQYLVPDVKALFYYMSEAEALKRWEPDSEKEIEITDNTRSYFRLYDNLSKVYFQFRQHLMQKGEAYRGMAYRLLAEDLETIVLDDLKYKHFYFIGLNALSKAEEQIISKLVKAKKATCLWDTDDWFMDSKHQAGEVLRRYQKTQLFGKWNAPENLLRTTEKEVNVYESPFNSLQAKVGSSLLTEANTVFVVPDENLIQPLLFSLGQEVEEYNITMGLGMAQSKLSALVNVLFEMQSIGTMGLEDTIRYSHSYVQKILSDPLIKRFEGVEYGENRPFEQIKNDIVAQNKVFIAATELTAHEKFMALLFKPWQKDPHKAVKSLKLIIETLREAIFESLDSMEKEFFLLISSVLNRLEDELRKHGNISLEAIRLLLKELSKLERVPFTGEPIAPLQIMSLLETRCLDFEHVVLFSFNEGVIPSSQKNNSLIPIEACKEYGIPVFSDQDSIMAYHFYRLMMRAKKVDIIYTNAKSTGLGGSKDVSRFVLQLVNNLAKENPKLNLELKSVDFAKSEESTNYNKVSIKKDENLINEIKKYLRTRGLSASSIQQYYNCPLDFYFTKILGLKEADEIEERFGADVFGNWIHYSIEIISKEIILAKTLINEDLKPKVLSAIPKVLERVFKEHFGGYQIDKGINLIYHKMAKKLLIAYYEQCVFEGREKVIISSEEKLSQTLNVKVGEENIAVKLNGTIDSIELHENDLVLVDFKTGKVEAKDLKLGRNESVEMAFANPKKGKLRQLIIYKYLVHKELESKQVNGFNIMPGTEVVAGMYTFRDLSSFLEQKSMSKEEVIEETEIGVSNLVNELLDINIPFEQSHDPKNCKYCSHNVVTIS